MTDLNTLGATELAQRLARRDITAEAVLRACLERIAEREPQVQAWEALAADAALAEARRLDAGPHRGLLHGLPLGVKDIFDSADLPAGLGSPIYAGNQPRADAAVVATCRAAGAVVLGKTVTTELATGTPSRTRNPHRLDRTPGGSSAGSAAAVADFMLPLAFGTQTAGSVIRPAAYCGIVGVKPSFGLLPRAGIKSQSETCDTVGVMARSVADAGLLLAAASGDAALAQVQPQGKPRWGLCLTPSWEQADADTAHAIDSAKRVLADHGGSLVELAPSCLEGLVELQMEIMFHEAAQAYSFENLFHRQQLGVMVRDMLDAGRGISPARHRAKLLRLARAREEIAAVFSGVDAIIAPSTTGEAPGMDNTGSPVFCRPWSLLGLPCVHVPVDRGSTGMPVGVQVIGPAAADARTLQAAAWLEGRLR